MYYRIGLLVVLLIGQLILLQAGQNARSQTPRSSPTPVNSMLSNPVGTSVLGPHGGELVGDNGNQFEVNINQKTGKIDVYQIETTLKPPNYMQIRLFHQSGEPETISLGSAPLQGDPTVHYQGYLDPSQTPNMGFELRFQQDKTSVQAAGQAAH